MISRESHPSPQTTPRVARHASPRSPAAGTNAATFYVNGSSGSDEFGRPPTSRSRPSVQVCARWPRATR